MRTRRTTPGPDRPADRPVDQPADRSEGRVRLGTRGSRLALTQSTQVARALEATALEAAAAGASSAVPDADAAHGPTLTPVSTPAHGPTLIPAHARTPTPARPLTGRPAGTGPTLPDRSAPVEIDLVTVRTQGDVDRTPLRDLGGIGVFAAQLRHALLDGSVDLAVHSFKDLPTQPVPGLAVTCVPAREDPRDALCARDGLTLTTLPEGARVGTGSPRRAAQLLAVRPDLDVVDLRGNVPTRLARVRGLEHLATGPGDLDAVVLAHAGLRRLGLDAHVTEVLDTELMLPAPAQGALAIETRVGIATALPRLAAATALLEDRTARLAVTAERALARRLGAGCAAPLGALAEPDGEPTGHGGSLVLRAVVASPDGSRLLRRSDRAALDHLTEDGAQALGVAVAEALLADGAEEVVDLHATKAGHCHPAPRAATSTTGTGPDPHPLDGTHVLLPRTKEPDALRDALAAAGAEVDRVDVTRTVAGEPGPRARAAARLTAGDYGWLVLSSPRTLDHVDLTGLPAATGLAVVGPGTARAVTATLGRRPDLVAAGSSAALLELAPLAAGPRPGASGAQRHVLLPGSRLAAPTLLEGLTAAGWEVDVVPVYTMEELVPADLPAGFTARWAGGGYDVVVLTAGSSTRALVHLGGLPPATTRVVTIGAPTAVAAQGSGLRVDLVASAPTPPAVCSAVVQALAGGHAQPCPTHPTRGPR